MIKPIVVEVVRITTIPTGIRITPVVAIVVIVVVLSISLCLSLVHMTVVVEVVHVRHVGHLILPVSVVKSRHVRSVWHHTRLPVGVEPLGLSHRKDKEGSKNLKYYIFF